MTKNTMDQKTEPLVSVVILNWNGLEDTLACIDSVNQLTYRNIELIVVDNGSVHPITQRDIQTNKPFTVVNNPVNLGFAGGEVSALPFCSGEYIFLLNNDAIIEKNAITEAVATMQSDNTIAAVGARSYSLLDESHESLDYYSFQYIDPVTAETHTYQQDDGIQDTVTVSGAAVMIRRSIIDEYGYFDERFFAYYEETDLFARYLRAGMRIVYNPNVIIWHKDGASTKSKRYMYYYLMLKNQFLFAYKNFDKEALRQFIVVYLRNFRRSLWICLKKRSKAEAIHKARVRSTIWNMVYIFGTISSRKKNLSINLDFNYTTALLTQQPIPATLVVDARESFNQSDLTKALEGILKSSSYPSEIIVVTTKPAEMPFTSHNVRVRNIVDKELYSISALDLGFITSNTDVLFNISYPHLIDSNSKLAETFVQTYRSIKRDESAFAIKDSKVSDVKLTNGGQADLIAIRKSDLVNFLDIHKEIYSIDAHVLGSFINWAVIDCRPVARVSKAHSSLEHIINTPLTDHPTLTNPLRWRVKKLIRLLHLARILSAIKKRIFKTKDSSSEMSRKVLTHFPKYKDTDIQNTPIFINMRDRVEPTLELINWLEKGMYTNIVFIDNDSSYPELIDLYNKTPYQVIPLGRNGMHKSPWESFAIRFIAKDKPYIVTDPDIIPAPETPKDTIHHLYNVLEKYPTYLKAGVALKINDLPDHYSMKQPVIEWESRFWDKSLLLEKDVYSADLDTTFALYQANTWWALSPSIRVAGKYEMRHEPWYQDLNNPSDDMMYYRARASNEVSTWTKGKLPKHHLRALKKEGLI